MPETPALRNKCAVIGVGNSRIGELESVTSLGLMAEAARNAVEDAGIEKDEIDGIICRGPDDIYTIHQRLGQMLGLNATFSTSLDNAGASQVLSVILAAMAIEAGLCKVVLCGYGRDAWSRTHRSEEVRMSQNPHGENGPRMPFNGTEFGDFGAPSTHAFGARRHMALYGTTKEQLGTIALAFREHANHNPDAQMGHKKLTMNDYLDGRQIVDPFNIYDCSLRTDVAGMVIVTSAERAKDCRQHPVLIRGFGTHNNLKGWYDDENMTTLAGAQSSKMAYEMAGIGPQEVDTFQAYDCFTYTALVQLEDYGFCAKGEGGPFAESGALSLDGALPMNTSGGQLSEGHAEGMLQVLEGVRQLRHTYGSDRQAPGAEIAAVTGHGGNVVCHSSLILQRA